ncbi:hypothetical protein RirG_136220 [Rhizophagus irregularis DAOM 197198w]|uniref:DUF8211 domain-containing protein n=1 Tax=Rhizophagus irregularis (strain DAOM 197198w) TaxID=1432141 RepID=A0A015JDT7_RHIIW|nr:hypothetical protein RirG_136220 [Rhizophagus irregularis DAOM 197198w]
MTNDRHACVDHQKEFFRNRLFHSTRHYVLRDQVPPNSKTSHAQLLYNRWKEGTGKQIFSRRLGIEYSMNYLAGSNKNIIRLHHRHMYMKRFSNFRFIPFPNPKTKKDQQKRFKRNCNRVFNTRYDSAYPFTSHLFTEIGNPDANVYKFNIPFYEPLGVPPVSQEDLSLDEPKLRFSGIFKVDLPSNAPRLNLNSSGIQMNNFNFNQLTDASASNDIITFSPHPAHTMVATVENYDPHQRNVCDPLKPFVPRSPIYDEYGHYLPPDSVGWRTKLKPKEFQCRLDKAKRKSTLHIYHGTSAKHLQRRLDTTTHLTTVQTTYHRYMNYATGTCSDRLYERERQRYQSYLDSLPKKYMLPHLEDIAYNDTSDDTKRLEVRLKKRDTLNNLCDRYLHRDQIKRIRLDTDYPIDSPVSSSNKS